MMKRSAALLAAYAALAMTSTVESKNIYIDDDSDWADKRPEPTPTSEQRAMFNQPIKLSKKQKAKLKKMHR